MYIKLTLQDTKIELRINTRYIVNYVSDEISHKTIVRLFEGYNNVSAFIVEETPEEIDQLIERADPLNEIVNILSNGVNVNNNY